MYLHKIRLENIKCFENIELDFTYGRNKPRLMTVILGDNGVGKTTLLQAIAITLGGEKVSNFLMKPSNYFYGSNLEGWARVGSNQGYIRAIIYPGKSDLGKPKRKLQVSYLVTGNEPVETKDGTFYDRSSISAIPNKDLQILRRTAYADHTQGWLACGYGPLRGFTGKQIFETKDTKSSRFASLFGQNDQLISVEDWLIELDRRDLIDKRERGTSNYGHIYNQLASTLLRMLPEEQYPATISVNMPPELAPADVSTYVKTTTDQGVLWLDSLGNSVTFSQLSDGYQSMMSLAGDLVSRLSRGFPETSNLLNQEGVVLIDEVDIHLHPTWQRKILNQLRQTFPNIQFIVTTHSPLVAASAKEGELFVLKEEQNRVVVEPAFSVQGWRADQILTSSLFDLDTTRDPETEQQLARYDELLVVRASGKLNEDQTQELASLEKELGKKLPAGDTPEQRQLYQEMRNYITQTLREKGE
jgi:predicted ATP-dependent endonuclease of OLD family